MRPGLPFPLLSRTGTGPLWGVCASSVDEARLGREEFGGEVHAFAAAWTEIAELLDLADHMSSIPRLSGGNSGPSSKAQPRARAENPIGAACASTRAFRGRCTPSMIPVRRVRVWASASAISTPCRPGGHFRPAFSYSLRAGGRRPGPYPGRRGEKFGPYLPACRWINMGGGHHITKPGYDLDLLCACLTRWRQRP